MNTAVDINHTSIAWPQFDPEAPEPRPLSAIEQHRVIEWISDDLAPEAFMPPLRELVEKDSQLFMQFLADHESGDWIAFEQSAGELARELKALIAKTAEVE